MTKPSKPVQIPREDRGKESTAERNRSHRLSAQPSDCSQRPWWLSHVAVGLLCVGLWQVVVIPLVRESGNSKTLPCNTDPPLVESAANSATLTTVTAQLLAAQTKLRALEARSTNNDGACAGAGAGADAGDGAGAELELLPLFASPLGVSRETVPAETLAEIERLVLAKCGVTSAWSSTWNDKFYRRQRHWSQQWATDYTACVNETAAGLPNPKDAIAAAAAAAAVGARCTAAADSTNGWRELRESSAWKTVLGVIDAHADRYLRAVGGEKLLNETQAESAGLWMREQIFVWAGVHREDSWHTPHVHRMSGVVGTLYITTPPGSSSLVFSDPRRQWGEEMEGRHNISGLVLPDVGAFAVDLSVTPAAGTIVMFPPWLNHWVGRTAIPAATSGQARVALSFNVRGTWLPLAAASRQAPGPNWTGDRPPTTLQQQPARVEREASGAAESRCDGGDGAPACRGISLEELLDVLAAEGRLAEAVSPLRVAVTSDLEVYGPNHEETLGSMDVLAACLFQLGEYADAEVVLRGILEIRTAMDGPEHPATRQVASAISEALRGQGKPADPTDGTTTEPVPDLPLPDSPALDSSCDADASRVGGGVPPATDARHVVVGATGGARTAVGGETLAEALGTGDTQSALAALLAPMSLDHFRRAVFEKQMCCSSVARVQLLVGGLARGRGRGRA
jgi:uncharacterized protein (TIGR02466 family)